MYALLYWCKCMRSDQWQKNRSHSFFQDLDWLSRCEQWQSLHLLIWHIRSCMLCSASSNDMRSDQWQTISVFTHLLPRFRLIAFQITMTKFFICWYDTVYKKLLLCPRLYCILSSGAAEFMRIQQLQTMTVYLELTLNYHHFPRSQFIVFR